MAAEQRGLVQVVEQRGDRGGVTGQRRPVVRIRVDAGQVDRADQDAPLLE
jgi:hypothetical protein